MPLHLGAPPATRDVSLHGSANDGTTSRQIEHALAHATHRGCCPVICARSASRFARSCHAWFPTTTRPQPLGMLGRRPLQKRSDATRRALREQLRPRAKAATLPEQSLTPDLRESVRICQGARFVPVGQSLHASARRSVVQNVSRSPALPFFGLPFSSATRSAEPFATLS